MHLNYWVEREEHNTDRIMLKGAGESILGKDSVAPLMHHDRRDLGRLILTRNILKEWSLELTTWLLK